MRTGGRGVRLALLAAASVLVLTACSGGGSDADPPSGDPSVDTAAVSRDLARLYTGDHSTPDGRSEGRCFAQAFLDQTDVDVLVAAGVIGDDGEVVADLPRLDADTAEAWVTAQESCTTFLDASTEALRAQSKGRIDADRYRRCLDRKLTDAEQHDAQVAALTGDLAGAAVLRLTDAQSACATLALPTD